jgi:tRNA(fMet)-specific endonuclease VapC
MADDGDEQLEPGLLDTNVVISLPDITDPAILPEDPRVCVVTIAELNVGPKVVEGDEALRAARQKQLEATEEAFEPLPFDVEAARAYGDVAASLMKRKEKRTARQLDALIAATAVANGMTLYTSNPKDFDGIDGLDVCEVPEPTRLTG